MHRLASGLPGLTDALMNLPACRDRHRSPRLTTSLSSHGHLRAPAPPACLRLRGISRWLSPRTAPRARRGVTSTVSPRPHALGCRVLLSPRAREDRVGYLPRHRSPRPPVALRRGLRPLSCGRPRRLCTPREGLTAVVVSPTALLVSAEAGPNPLAGIAARCEGFGARGLPLLPCVAAIAPRPGRPPRGRPGLLARSRC